MAPHSCDQAVSHNKIEKPSQDMPSLLSIVNTTTSLSGHLTICKGKKEFTDKSFYKALLT